MGKNRPYAGLYSGGNAGYLRMADHYCVHAEGDLVHFVPDSAVRCDMIDYEEVVEAIWSIVQGKVDNWTDYEGDQLQITIDGTTYLVHAANAIMKT